MKLRYGLLLSTFCGGLLSGSVAIAAPYSSAFDDMYSRLKVRGLVNFQYITEDNDDLGTKNEEREDSLAAQARLMLNYKFSDELDGYFDFRGYRIKGDSGAQDDTGEIIFNQDFLEIRQYWLRQKNLFNYLPLSLKVGRQRIKEPQTIWWNRDFDAVRLDFDKTLTKGFVGVGENLVAYRTNGSDHQEDDKRRLRLFGELSHQYVYNHFFDTRVLYEHDHSDREYTGYTIDSNDRDLSDAKLAWFGTRNWGKFKAPMSGISNMNYRLDVMGVYGTERTLTTTTAANPNFQNVTGVGHTDVMAWGLDAGLDASFDVPLSPTVRVGYAYGSGDDDLTDTDDTAFRQTGLHGNSKSMSRGAKGIRNYGEVFRPELSNLHVASAGVQFPVMDASTLDVDYHTYWLDEKNAPLRNDGISGTLTGQNSHLGQSLDISYNSEIMSEYNIGNNAIDKTYLKLMAGSFHSGDAYAPNGDDRNAFRFIAELEFRF